LAIGSWFVPQLPEPNTVKNRVHLDLTCDDLDVEMARLVGLGARVLAVHEGFVVLADPEENEFCLLR
jgi:predicted enzyme related to lactoylglutathione lyase